MLDDEWLAALADAGILASSAELIVLGGPESHDGCRAKYWRPGDPLDADVARLDNEPGLTRDLHRVALWGDHSIEGASGLLRHELEHARQLLAHSEPLLLQFQACEDRLIEEVGGLPGSARLYQDIPMEQDANAAAARFLRRRFPTAQLDELLAAGDPDSAVLRDHGEPGPLETLPARMEQFLQTVRERCAEFRQEHGLQRPESAGSPRNPENRGGIGSTQYYAPDKCFRRSEARNDP